MSDLKQIKIFLASSIVEFDHERDELQTYITRLNKEYISRGIYFDLEVCENVSNAFVATRKQDEYNDIIRASRYVYLLVGERIGQYTEEEFDVALEQFRKTGTPFIYTYFKRLPEGTSADQSVTAFMQRLGKGLGHYWSEYSDLDSIKLNIILELMRDPEVGGVVQFEDGRALLNGEEMVSLENVPIYGGNDELQAMRAELSALETKCAELKAEIATTLDEDAMMEFSAAAKRKAELADQIHAAEMAVLENMNLIASKSASGEEVDPREREAARLVGEGNYRGANAVLRDSQWEADMDTAAEVEEGLREKARRYVSSRRALISNLKSMGVTKKSAPEIEAAYERACEVAERWHVECSVLGEFAHYLRGQRDYKKAVEYAKRNMHWCELDAGSQHLSIARAYALLGDIQHLKREDVSAERSTQTAIDVLLSKAERTPEEDLEIAYAQTSLGSICWSTKRYPEAKELLESAINTMESNEAADKDELSQAYNRLAVVSNGLNLLADAEGYHMMAARLRDELAATGDPKRLRDLSITYHNLGNFYSREKRYEESEASYAKAVEIREKLAADNPAAYEPNLATTAIQRGCNLRRMRLFEDAERETARGLNIRRRLVSRDEAVFSDGVAIALMNYGIILRDAGWQDRFDEACSMFEEAISIREKFVAQNRPRYEPGLAEMYDEFAKLLALMGQTERAREMFERAINTRRTWFDDDADVHGNAFSMFCQDFAAFLRSQGESFEAESYARQAFEIREGRYAEYPDVYAVEFAETCKTLAEVLESNGNSEEAAEMRARAAEVQAANAR